MPIRGLYKYLIMAQTAWATLQISVRVILWSYSKKCARVKGDLLVRKWARRLLNIVKADFQVHNPHHIQIPSNTPTIIMSNHASHYDIPLIFLTFSETIRMVAKKELFRVPVWGRALQATEFVSIDRGNRQQALKDLEYAKEKMRDGIVLWISPEGGRTRDGQLRDFKKGGFMLALQTGATIIPVGLRNTDAILPADTWNFALGKHIDIHIGEPIKASEYTLEQRDELIQTVRTSIKQLLGDSHDES